MKKLANIFLILVFTGWVGSTQASVIEYNFEVTGWSEGAILNGMFIGEDLDNDGMLVYDELTEFMVDWSGNSLISSFSHTIANLVDTFASTTSFDFRFDLVAEDLLSFASCRSLSSDSCGRPTVFRSLGSPVFGIDSPLEGVDASNASYQVKVSSPTTLVLLGLTLAGLGWIGRKKA